jgi:hypothetical protein
VVSKWCRGEALPIGSDRLYAHAQHKATPSVACPNGVEVRRVVSEWRRGEALSVGSDGLYATPSTRQCQVPPHAANGRRRLALQLTGRPHAKGFFRF